MEICSITFVSPSISDSSCRRFKLMLGIVGFADALAKLNLPGIRGNLVRHEAVADKKFESALGQAKANDSTAIVKLDKYQSSPDNDGA